MNHFNWLMGGSDAPPAGYDKKTMAADVAALIRELGYDQVNLAGRDIGSMVAFSLAANRPELVRKLAMQAELLPEQLLAGRARSLIDFMCARNLRDPGRHRRLRPGGLRARVLTARGSPRGRRLVPLLRARHRRPGNIPARDNPDRRAALPRAHRPADQPGRHG